MTFWKSTLKIFLPKPVRMVVRRGADRLVLIGSIESIFDYSCTIKKADGELVPVGFEDILELTEVRV